MGFLLFFDIWFCKFDNFDSMPLFIPNLFGYGQVRFILFLWSLPGDYGRSSGTTLMAFKMERGRASLEFFQGASALR